MLQGLAACFDSDGVGLEFSGGLQIGDSVTDVTVARRPKPAPPGGSFLERVEQAVQAAVHPNSPIRVASDSGVVGSNVVPFPVVSPYRPLTATRAPIAGLTAFPNKGYHFNSEANADFNRNGDDPNDFIPPGHESLGFIDPVGTAPIGVGLDEYSPMGMKWEGIIGQITQTTPAIISAVRGQPYYDPSQNVNPQLSPATQAVLASTRPAPEGYYYDDRGSLRQIGSEVGGAVGSVGQSVSDFVQRNPLLVLGGGVALVLLFMTPPRRR